MALCVSMTPVDGSCEAVLGSLCSVFTIVVLYSLIRSCRSPLSGHYVTLGSPITSCDHSTVSQTTSHLITGRQARPQVGQGVGINNSEGYGSEGMAMPKT